MDDLKDIKPLIVPFDWLFWMILLLIVVVIGVFLFFYFKYFLKKKQIIKKPWEIAREQLEALNASGLLEQGKYDQYYVVLTGIIRRYMNDHCLVPAIHMSTSELKQYVSVIDNEYQHELIELLPIFSYADMVKFAKADAVNQIAQEHYQMIIKFIELTCPQGEKG